MLDPVDVRLVAGLLIAGFFVFLTGACMWKPAYEGSWPDSLRVIASSPARWRWIHTWMIAGVIVTLLGLGGLTHLFLIAEGRVYSTFGFLLFAVGSLVWVVGVVWRLTVLLWAATEASGGRSIPQDVHVWSGWFGHLHTMHLLLAYLSWIAVAASILDTGILAQWIAWTGAGLGIVGASGYLAMRGGPFAPPILAHLYPLIVGVALLVEWW